MCFARYIRTRCFCIRNLTRSLPSLVPFLIRQQLVREYCTPALSMKFSLSNRPHFLWVYRRDNPRGMLGEHEKSLRAEGE